MELVGSNEAEVESCEGPVDATRSRSLFELSAGRVAILAFLISVTVMFLYRPLSRVERGDPAIWDYVAQSVLRGQVPYRDVVEIKGPASAYLSASAMAVGRVLGARDTIAVRIMQILMVGLLSAISYLVAEAYFRSRAAGLLAFLFPLMSESFARLMITGTQPKLGMTLFGMLTLALIAKDKPFWAGSCSMLSCLCWQPGLLFTGTAVLIFSRYLASWRDRRALKVIIGALTPLAAVVAYFLWVEALADFWNWTVIYNLSVYAPAQAKTLPNALSHVWKITRQTFEADIVLVAIGALGMVVYLVDCVRPGRTPDDKRPRPPYRYALLIPPVAYLAFCVIDFQGDADLIPIFPFIGLFLGWITVRTLSRLMALTVFKRRLPRLANEMACWVAPACMAFLVFARAASYRDEPGETLQAQETDISRIGELLGPNDKIYVHGRAEILVLLDRANMNPYIMLDNHKDDFAAARRYGGSFKAIIAEMESDAPKLVALSRLRLMSHRDELAAWVEEHYQRLDRERYDRVLIRKQ